MIVKQDNDKLTLFLAEEAYNNIKMRPDELPISYFNRIIQAIDMVKSRDVDVENDRNYTEDQRVLRMVKGLDPARFGELQLTLDQDQKRGLTTMPKTMLETLQLINDFKVKAPTTGMVGLQGFTKAGFNADKGVVFVNEFEAEYTPTTEEIHLKIVVDRSSVELFTSDGVRSISLAVFPDPGTNRQLEPFRE
jgi:hypothetical protein